MINHDVSSRIHSDPVINQINRLAAPEKGLTSTDPPTPPHPHPLEKTQTLSDYYNLSNGGEMFCTKQSSDEREESIFLG